MQEAVKESNDLFFHVRVVTHAHVNEVIGWECDRLKVRLRAIAEKGRANAALIKLLADHFSLMQSQISIVRGKTSHNKIIKIRSCNKELAFNISKRHPLPGQA